MAVSTTGAYPSEWIQQDMERSRMAAQQSIFRNQFDSITKPESNIDLDKNLLLLLEDV